MKFEITKITNHDNFISEYETNLDCSSVISYYEFIKSCGLTIKRSNIEKTVDDQVFVHQLPEQILYDNTQNCYYQDWNDVVEVALRQYIFNHTILANKNLQHTLCKIQKTNPKEGYHAWHYENTPNCPYRQLVTMMYLNDDYDGGETEFLYQSFRVKPKTGKVVIFPCSWPWTHRGNPPIKKSKYILTSWVEEFPNLN